MMKATYWGKGEITLVKVEVKAKIDNLSMFPLLISPSIEIDRLETVNPIFDLIRSSSKSYNFRFLSFHVKSLQLIRL